MNEAMRDWVTNVADTFYCIGTAAGPHPYPAMVRDFQCVIGEETRSADAGGRGPAAGQSLVACIGGGSNAIGLFHPFLDEPGDRDLSASRRRAMGSTAERPCGLARRRPARRAARQSHLSAAGRGRADRRRPFDLRRPRLSRHRAGAFLAATRRAASTYLSATDNEALDAFQLCAQAGRHHPGAGAGARARQSDRTSRRKSRSDHLMVMNISGRGDKDIFTVAEHLGGM